MTLLEQAAEMAENFYLRFNNPDHLAQSIRDLATSPAAQAVERGHWKGGDLGADRVDAAGRIIGSVHKHSLGWHWTAEFELKYLGKYVDRESAEAAVIDAESRAESRTAEQGAVGEVVSNAGHAVMHKELPIGTKLYVAPPTVIAEQGAAEKHLPFSRDWLRGTFKLSDDDADFIMRAMDFAVAAATRAATRAARDFLQEVMDSIDGRTVIPVARLDAMREFLADALPAEAPEGREAFAELTADQLTEQIAALGECIRTGAYTHVDVPPERMALLRGALKARRASPEAAQPAASERDAPPPDWTEFTEACAGLSLTPSWPLRQLWDAALAQATPQAPEGE